MVLWGIPLLISLSVLYFYCLLQNINKLLILTGDSLESGYRNVSEALKKVNNMLENDSTGPVNDMEFYITEYSKYRYYVGIAESSILLLIIVCVTLGLMCGVCGKRPDGYDDDCCNKGAGSRFLMIGVAVMFLFSFLLMLITLLYFLTGSLSQRMVCDPMRNPNDSRIFTMLDNLTKIDTIVASNISTIIHECHKNQSAYNVLKLENKLNVSDLPNYLEKYGITEQIEKFKKNVNITEKIKIMTPQTEAEMENLKNSGIGEINFDRFMHLVSIF